MAWDTDALDEHWGQWLGGVTLVLLVVIFGASVLLGWLSQTTAALVAAGAAIVAGTFGTAWQAGTAARSVPARWVLRSTGAALAATALVVLVRGLMPPAPIVEMTWQSTGQSVEWTAQDQPVAMRLSALPRGEGRQAEQRVTARILTQESVAHHFSWNGRPHVDSEGFAVPKLLERWETITWIPAGAATKATWTSVEPAGRAAIRVGIYPISAPWPWFFALSALMGALICVVEARVVPPRARTHAAAGALAACAWMWTARAGFPLRAPLLDVGGALGVAVLVGGIAGVAVRALARPRRMTPPVRSDETIST